MRGDFYRGEKLDEKVNDWIVTAQKRLDTWWCRRKAKSVTAAGRSQTTDLYRSLWPIQHSAENLPNGWWAPEH